MGEIIRPVKGTRDFYPELMAQRTWLYNHIRTVSESYGYQEWEAPIIEALELYAAKSGEELVKEQAFVFPDRGGALLALRPELTPSLARLIAQRARELPRPIRWWSFGPFWRYERPQKGRTREFFQWNIDLLGSASIVADAEIASIGARLLAVLVVIEVSDVIFAVDSVPAVLAVSREQFIVFASNAFAILGLRALYFLLADMRERFVYMPHTISLLLVYVGIKMSIAIWYHIPVPISLGIIIGVLTVGILASIVKDRRKKV